MYQNNSSIEHGNVSVDSQAIADEQLEIAILFGGDLARGRW